MRLPRLGIAAEEGEKLARRARTLGYNERRVHEVEERRALRERLAASPRRAELAGAIDALYRAQVAERQVPLVGLRVEDVRDTVLGFSQRSYFGFVGVSWPLAHPFVASEGAVPFLKLEYAQHERRFDSGFEAVTRGLSLLIELNREMELALRWSRPGRSPLEVVLQTSSPDELVVEYRYAFGR